MRKRAHSTTCVLPRRRGAPADSPPLPAPPRSQFLRTARTAFYGGALFGPLLTKWLELLQRLRVQNRVREVVYKVWLDQTVFTPGQSQPPSSGHPVDTF